VFLNANTLISLTIAIYLNCEIFTTGGTRTLASFYNYEIRSDGYIT